MPTTPWLLAVVYILGAAWCLFMSDARAIERLMLAILWPIGPIAFVLTVCILLIASVIAYPIVMVPAFVAIGLFVWWVFF